jgi:hypothetical protein
LKRPPGRTIRGIQCPAAELASERIDSPLRPAVERIGKAIAIFRTVRKSRPLTDTGKAEQDQGEYGPAVNIRQ